jgi:protein gp37
VGEITKISWADSTFNPWIGCTHAGDGCKNCYAEAQNKRYNWNGGGWGDAAPRKLTSEKNWTDPVRWDIKAEAGRRGKDGKHWLVFAGDLCDIFDPRGNEEARLVMWELFRETPHLTWMILTKRPQFIERYLPSDWGEGYHNVWLGTTAENRRHGYPRINALRKVPAKIRFVSFEPLLEDVSDVDLTGIQWAVVGGESGAKARPFDVDWARAIKRQCKKFSTKFFFKQLGRKAQLNGVRFPMSHQKPDGKKDVHGVMMANFPSDLQVQEWPK